jgi:hypothetical protein
MPCLTFESSGDATVSGALRHVPVVGSLSAANGLLPCDPTSAWLDVGREACTPRLSPDPTTGSHSRIWEPILFFRPSSIEPQLLRIVFHKHRWPHSATRRTRSRQGKSGGIRTRGATVCRGLLGARQGGLPPCRTGLHKDAGGGDVQDCSVAVLDAGGRVIPRF